MYVAMIAVIGATAAQGFAYDDMGVRFGALCHTIYFIVPNTVNSVVNAVFIVIAIKISRSINEYNSGQMALIQDEVSSNIQGTAKEIMFRKRSVCNMWLIIGSISALVTF